MSEWSSRTDWASAQVPPRHARREIGGLRPQWTERLGRIAAVLGTGALIGVIGPRGTGKTQLGVELIRKTIFERGTTGIYTTAVELFMAVKETYGEDARVPGSKVLLRYRAPALLVLDEIHERGATAWEDTLLTTLMDQRYRELKDTILIANLKPDEFLAHVGPSISSRLQETGMLVECKWKSFREGGVECAG